MNECYYRVLRSDETLSRETTARANYELGAEALDPPPWARRLGASSACNYRYFDKPNDAVGDAMNVDQAPDMCVKLSPGDHPPLVSGLDFSQLFIDHNFHGTSMDNRPQLPSPRGSAVMEAACIQTLHEASEALKCNIRRKPNSADIRLLLKVNVTIAELAMKRREHARDEQTRSQAPPSSGAPGDARRNTRS